MSEPTKREAPRPRGRSLRSLVFVLASLVLLALLSKGLIQSWLASNMGQLVWAPIVHSMKDSDLPKAQHLALVEELDQVSQKFEAGAISQAQLYAVSMNFSRRLLAKLIRLMAVENQQFAAAPQLKAAQRQRAKKLVQGLAKAVLAGQLKRRDIRPMHDTYRSFGQRSKPRAMADSDRQAFLRDIEVLLSRVPLTEKSPPPMILQELKKAIEEGLEGAS